MTYPQNPNTVTKKKYYEFIQNFPLFMPSREIGNNFSRLLDKYPVEPYLSDRLAFMKWVHFINNKLLVKLELPEVDFYDSLENYYNAYKPKELLKMCIAWNDSPVAIDRLLASTCGVGENFSTYPERNRTLVQGKFVFFVSELARAD